MPTVYGTSDSSTTLVFDKAGTEWKFTPDANVAAYPAGGIMVCADWWNNEGITWTEYCG